MSKKLLALCLSVAMIVAAMSGIALLTDAEEPEVGTLGGFSWVQTQSGVPETTTFDGKDTFKFGKDGYGGASYNNKAVANALGLENKAEGYVVDLKVEASIYWERPSNDGNNWFQFQTFTPTAPTEDNQNPADTKMETATGGGVEQLGDVTGNTPGKWMIYTTERADARLGKDGQDDLYVGCAIDNNAMYICGMKFTATLEDGTVKVCQWGEMTYPDYSNLELPEFSWKNDKVTMTQYDGYDVYSLAKGEFSYNNATVAHLMKLTSADAVELTISMSYFWDKKSDGDWMHFITINKDGSKTEGDGFTSLNDAGMTAGSWQTYTCTRADQVLGYEGKDDWYGKFEINDEGAYYVRGITISAKLEDGSVRTAVWGTMTDKEEPPADPEVKLVNTNDTVDPEKGLEIKQDKTFGFQFQEVLGLETGKQYDVKMTFNYMIPTEGGKAADWWQVHAYGEDFKSANTGSYSTPQYTGGAFTVDGDAQTGGMFNAKDGFQMAGSEIKNTWLNENAAKDTWTTGSITLPKMNIADLTAEGIDAGKLYDVEFHIVGGGESDPCLFYLKGVKFEVGDKSAVWGEVPAEEEPQETRYTLTGATTTMNLEDKTNGEIVEKDGKYAWKMGGSNGLWFGIGDADGILNDATKVTYEAEVMFDTTNLNDRFFFCYGDKEAWRGVNDKTEDPYFNGFAAHGNWKPTPAVGEWGICTIQNDNFDPTRKDGDMLTKIGSWVVDGSLYIRSLKIYDSENPEKVISLVFNNSEDTPPDDKPAELPAPNAMNGENTKLGTFQDVPAIVLDGSNAWFCYSEAYAISKALGITNETELDLTVKMAYYWERTEGNTYTAKNRAVTSLDGKSMDEDGFKSGEWVNHTFTFTGAKIGETAESNKDEFFFASNVNGGKVYVRGIEVSAVIDGETKTALWGSMAEKNDGDTKPTETTGTTESTKTTETDPTKPTETEPVVPTETEPTETEPTETEPDVTEPDVTEPDVTEPDVSEPDESEPTDEEPSDTEAPVQTTESLPDNTETGEASAVLPVALLAVAAAAVSAIVLKKKEQN